MDSIQYRPPNADQEVSNTNHFGSVSDSLGRLTLHIDVQVAIATGCTITISALISVYS